MGVAALKSQLAGLGISANEAEVYLALAEHGPCGAGKLITATELHRNVVYTSLNHLSFRKLISESQVRGARQFALNSPSILIDEFERKSELAREVAASIAGKIRRGAQEITVHQGNEEYLALLTGVIRHMPCGSTKYVLGTGGEAFMRLTMRPIWNMYHQAAKIQGISIKMLGYENQRSVIQADVCREGIYQIRFLPNSYENPAGVHIYPEAATILNIIYSDEQSPVTAIRIKNTSLADGYMNLFQNLWQIALE